jgi:hypothetical protein
MLFFLQQGNNDQARGVPLAAHWVHIDSIRP